MSVFASRNATTRQSTRKVKRRQPWTYNTGVLFGIITIINSRITQWCWWKWNKVCWKARNWKWSLATNVITASRASHTLNHRWENWGLRWDDVRFEKCLFLCKNSVYVVDLNYKWYFYTFLYNLCFLKNIHHVGHSRSVVTCKDTKN